MDEQVTKMQTRVFDMESALKDTEFYASSLEKENHFLREEIEKTKYSKDKQEYNKFLGGLTQLRNKKQTAPSAVNYKEYSATPISSQNK